MTKREQLEALERYYLSCMALSMCEGERNQLVAWYKDEVKTLLSQDIH